MGDSGREISVTGRRQAQTCTFCRGAIDEAPASPCTACETPLHDACWAEVAGCPLLGCRGVRALPSPETGCAFCRRKSARGLAEVLRSSSLWTCPGCGEQGHPDCWGTICPTAGCRQLPPEVRRELESGRSGRPLSDGCIAVMAIAVIVICAYVIDVVVDVLLPR